MAQMSSAAGYLGILAEASQGPRLWQLKQLCCHCRCMPPFFYVLPPGLPPRHRVPALPPLSPVSSHSKPEQYVALFPDDRRAYMNSNEPAAPWLRPGTKDEWYPRSASCNTARVSSVLPLPACHDGPAQRPPRRVTATSRRPPPPPTRYLVVNVKIALADERLSDEQLAGAICMRAARGGRNISPLAPCARARCGLRTGRRPWTRQADARPGSDIE
ncbi:hypothetical protein C8Q80DRAFT_22583 [Daedaleopsis nitida]|nr:hypothetical protein C8Q80DRAFT_22583 [Daedaleopsis nitida]